MSKIHLSESERSSGDHKTVGFFTHNFSWPYGQPRDRPIRKGWWGWEIFKDQSPVIYHLGGGGILEGITWFWREQKGGSVVTENPKGGITENFGRIQMGDHSNLLGKWRHGGWGWGIAKVIKCYLGRSLQWSEIQRGDWLNFLTQNPFLFQN